MANMRCLIDVLAFYIPVVAKGKGRLTFQTGVDMSSVGPAFVFFKSKAFTCTGTLANMYMTLYVRVILLLMI